MIGGKTVKDTVLEIDDFVVSFRMYTKGCRKKSLEVIHSLSLSIQKGEIIAVVGSSGSGKSILASAILNLLPKNACVDGTIRYHGESLNRKTVKKYLGNEIAFIPQSVSYLDPLMRVGKQVMGVNGTKEEKDLMFEKYELAKEVGDMYPFELSGGMARRVLISGAVMKQPKLIIADEPTPGLTIELAMETLHHFKEIANQGGSILLITHDIDLALEVADKIAVFYAGTIVEIAPTSDFVAGKNALRHPYSKAFLDALPQNGMHPLAGTQPYAGNLPKGCLFADRCNLCDEACSGCIPMREVRDGKVRCVHAD